MKDKKRVFIRKPASHKITIKKIGDMEILENVSAQTIDIAGGGMAFTFNTPIKLETIVKLSVNVPSTILETEGIVKRCEKQGENNYYIALKFINMSNEDIAAIYYPV